VNANLVHVTAITSGILSMISFGYSYLMKGSWSKLAAILHTLVSIGLMLGILYLNFTYKGLADAHMPTLDANATIIDQRGTGDRGYEKQYGTQRYLSLHLAWYPGPLFRYRWSKGLSHSILITS